MKILMLYKGCRALVFLDHLPECLKVHIHISMCSHDIFMLRAILNGVRLPDGQSSCINCISVKRGGVIFIWNTFILVQDFFAFDGSEIKDSLRVRFSAHMGYNASNFISSTDSFKISFKRALSFVSLSYYFFNITGRSLMNMITRTN